MLQHLELTDRPAELLARLEILQRRLVHRLHRADRLGAQRGDRLVHHVLDRRQRVARSPSTSSARTRTPDSVTSAARSPSCVG